MLESTIFMAFQRTVFFSPQLKKRNKTKTRVLNVTVELAMDTSKTIDFLEQ